MRLSSIARAAGLTLAHDLPPLTVGGPPLLRAGTTITPAYQQALTEAGIGEVWVVDALTEDVAPRERLPAAVRQLAAERVAHALTVTAETLGDAHVLSEATLTELRGVVELIAESIAESSDLTLAVHDLGPADALRHRHSVTVCAVGLLLGHALFERRGWVDHAGRARRDRLRPRLAHLGLGLLLHDQRPERLPDTVSPLVRSVLLGHEERWDGTGSPRGLAGGDIHQFARIAAVADAFDEATAARPHRPAAPAHEGLRVVRLGRGTAFDPEVVDVLHAVVVPYPVGTTLVLDDHVEGVVVSVDPADPERPWVRVPAPGGSHEMMVDLAEVGALGVQAF